LELLDLGVELRIRLAAVEERHLVPAGERCLYEMATEEERSAEDKQLHSTSPVTIHA
jgi:hypothetical protein